MLIVSDTSPIRALHIIDKVSVLEDLFGEVLVPPAVLNELLTPPPVAVSLDRYRFIQTRAPQHILPELAHLDAGEREAISLARELAADWLLIDERDGYRAAISLGLRTVGVVGILLEGKRRNRIELVAPLLNRLRTEARFYLADELVRDVLKRAGEEIG